MAFFEVSSVEEKSTPKTSKKRPQKMSKNRPKKVSKNRPKKCKKIDPKKCKKMTQKIQKNGDFLDFLDFKGKMQDFSKIF